MVNFPPGDVYTDYSDSQIERWTYPFECLFMGHGFFSVSPVLIFGTVGLIIASAREVVLNQKWCMIIGLGLAVQILFHILLVDSCGGWSYGFRYLISIIPLMLFFVPVVLERWQLQRVIFFAILSVSVLFALIGTYYPWPPTYEQEANKGPIASLVTNPVSSNPACWLEQYIPQTALSEWATSVYINPNKELQREYFKYFFFSKHDLKQVKKYLNSPHH